MKVIDIEFRGNLIKFYYGADECNDYWGDDWNDPYENARVYDKYVVATAVYAVPWNYQVFEAADANYFHFVKQNFKLGVEPFAVIAAEDYYLSFQYATTDPECVRLHFEMSAADVDRAMGEINAVLMSGAAHGVASHPKNI